MKFLAETLAPLLLGINIDIILLTNFIEKYYSSVPTKLLNFISRYIDIHFSYRYISRLTRQSIIGAFGSM
jgi:hypothetical protein